MSAQPKTGILMGGNLSAGPPRLVVANVEMECARVPVDRVHGGKHREFKL